jgi:multidrug efflux pump subunit AcrA (membrane-fusion protein)
MVRIDLPLNTQLRPGNFVKGEISLGKVKVNSVGSSSVVYKDNRAIAYTLDSTGKKVQMHFIEVGGRDGDYIEVLSGLKAGEQVVAKGAGFIKDGDVVNVLKAK